MFGEQVSRIEFQEFEIMKDKAHWARFAEEWIAWARSPDHDAFWMYRRAFARFSRFRNWQCS